MDRRRFLSAGVAAAGAVRAQTAESKFVVSKNVRNKADPLDWYPLPTGTQWTYDCEERTGKQERPDIARWRRVVTVLRTKTTPDGLVVLRRVVDAQPSSYAGEFSPHYLVQGSYIYAMSLRDVDEISAEVTPAMRARLAAGDVTPEFFFPLQAGLLWAERTREESDPHPASTFYYWSVDGRGAEGRGGAMPVKKDAYHLTFQTVGGPAERWFEKGVGIVAEWDYHAGTYWEHKIVLKDFKRG